MSLKSDSIQHASCAANGCCVLNAGSGSWAFEPLANQLSSVLGIPVSDSPQRFNYVLCLDTPADEFKGESFIPFSSIRIASDKRLIAQAFEREQVPTPRTVLLGSYAEVTKFVGAHNGSEWCLKYPTSCGANGHRLVGSDTPEPANWPGPFIVQEFIRLERPEVYRVYAAGGELFGWVARRFPSGTSPSPWVAHARGARYENLEQAPPGALEVARVALQATGLIDSFGCADLLRRSSGEWVALEVGTDGIHNHVDRELNDPEFEEELLQRICRSFWNLAADGR